MEDEIKQIFPPNVAQVGMDRGIDKIEPSITNGSDNGIDDRPNRATIEPANSTMMALTVAYEWTEDEVKTRA